MAADMLLSRVQTFLKQQQLLRSDVRLVVAVSGGPDSLCLLHVLWSMRAMGGPDLHIAHLDHGFRGVQSAAEARFVADIARMWGIPATIDYTDVPALIRATHQNSHVAARSVRYAFLHRVAHAVDAHAVALAHHADDQAETVLLHLMHGAGPAGLRGMQAVAAQETLLIRPLLGTTRREIEQYCTEHDLAPRHDPSNTDPHYTRSRVRTHLIPSLAEYNHQIVAALGRTARICADDYAYIQSELDRVWPDLIQSRQGVITMYADPWSRLHPALQRYALRRAASQLTGVDALSYEQIEAGRNAATYGAGHQQTLAYGLLLRVEHGRFLIIHSPTYGDGTGSAENCVDLPQLTSDDLLLNVAGITPLSATWYAEAGYGMPASHLPAQLAPSNEHEQSSAGHFPDSQRTEGEKHAPSPWQWRVILDADTLDGPLRFRQRQPGDRFRPAGGRGSRRLQDFLIDQRLPRELRAAWPILATQKHIVWVAGLRADDRFQATESTRRRLWVMLRRRSCA